MRIMDNMPEPETPLEGPLVRVWHIATFFALVPVSIALGSLAADPGLPLALRLASGLSLWGIPILLTAGCSALARRLDEFQRQLLWRGMAQGAMWGVSMVVALTFYHLIFGIGAPGVVSAVAMTPAMCAAFGSMMIFQVEWRARRTGRDAA